MRALTAPEIAVLQSRFRAVHTRVEIRNAAGAWMEYSDVSGRNWIIGFRVSRSIDEPIATARISIRRNHGALSLSPFRGDSPLNAGGPAIDAGRAVRVSTATVAHGAVPAPGDWRTVFEGEIDRVPFPASTIEIVARDPGGHLVDAWIEQESSYGSEEGTPLHTVMQDILNDWAEAETLIVPVVPGFMITSYPLDKQSVWDAIRTLAATIGWDVRYKWHEATGGFRLHLLQPDRAKMVLDWTFAESQYHSINELTIDREHVRNVVEVSYYDSEDEERKKVVVSDAASIARYGRRWMEIEQADEDPIDTEAEATALANAALSDLAWPIADKGVELPYFWPVEIGDLLQFLPGQHTSDALELAVTGIEHEITASRERTILSVRGKPAGSYLHWIHRGALLAGLTVSPPLNLVLTCDKTTALETQDGMNIPRIIAAWAPSPSQNLDRYVIEYRHIAIIDEVEFPGQWNPAQTADPLRTNAEIMPVTDGEKYEVRVRAVNKAGGKSGWISETVIASTKKSRPFGLLIEDFGIIRRTKEYLDIGGVPGELVDTVWVFDKLVEEPESGMTVRPRLLASDVPTAILDAVDGLDPDGNVVYQAAYPPRGFQRYIFFVPVDEDGNEGRREVIRIDPKPGVQPYFSRIRQSSLGIASVDVFGTVTDPEVQPGTLYVWGTADPFDGPAGGSFEIIETPFTFGPGTAFNTGNLLNDIPMLPGVTQHIALEFVTLDGRTTGQQLITLEDSLEPLVDEFGNLRVESWRNALELAEDLVVPGVGPDFPPDGSVYTLWYHTGSVPPRMYRWNGSTWVPQAIDGAGIIAESIVAGQLAAGAVRAEAIAAGAILGIHVGAHQLVAEHFNIGNLSLIASDLGAIVDGVLTNLDASAGLDLTATGSAAFLFHPAFTLLANGDAIFSGELQAAGGTFSGDISWSPNSGIYGDAGSITLQGGLGILSISGAGSGGSMDFSGVFSASSIGTSFFNFGGQFVDIGAADSGGLGFRALVVPN